MDSSHINAVDRIFERRFEYWWLKLRTRSNQMLRAKPIVKVPPPPQKLPSTKKVERPITKEVPQRDEHRPKPSSRSSSASSLLRVPMRAVKSVLEKENPCSVEGRRARSAERYRDLDRARRNLPVPGEPSTRCASCNAEEAHPQVHAAPTTSKPLALGAIRRVLCATSNPNTLVAKGVNSSSTRREAAAVPSPTRRECAAAKLAEYRKQPASSTAARPTSRCVAPRTRPASAVASSRGTARQLSNVSAEVGPWEKGKCAGTKQNVA